MTDKEILQGIDRLDAELPFDEICVGGKDNWHDIDVHELLYEVRERIKGWHYPSKGELPDDNEIVLLSIKGRVWKRMEFGQWNGQFFVANDSDYSVSEIKAWMPLPDPPKEEA